MKQLVTSLAQNPLSQTVRRSWRCGYPIPLARWQRHVEPFFPAIPTTCLEISKSRDSTWSTARACADISEKCGNRCFHSKRIKFLSFHSCGHRNGVYFALRYFLKWVRHLTSKYHLEFLFAYLMFAFTFLKYFREFSVFSYSIWTDQASLRE